MHKQVFQCLMQFNRNLRPNQTRVSSLQSWLNSCKCR